MPTRRTILASIIVNCLCYAKENDVTLEQLLVSATGFEENIEKDSSNAVIIDQKFFQNKGYSNIKQILEQTPGVTFVGNEIDLRGQGQSAKTHVKVMRDGMGLNGLDAYHGSTPYNTLIIEEIERIEILPGGGAVLYGSGTKGGTINIITKAPNKDFSAKIYAKGNFQENNKNLSGQYGVSVSKKITDFFFLKAAIQGFNEQGVVKGEKTDGLYASLDSYSPIDDKHKLRFKGSFYTANLLEIYTLKKSNPNEIKLSKARNQSYDLMLEYQGMPQENLGANFMAYYRNKNFKYTSSVFADHSLGAKGKLKWTYGNTQDSNGDLIVGYDLIASDATTASKYSSTKPSKLVNALFFLEKHNFNSWFSLLGGLRYENAFYHTIKTSKQKETFNQKHFNHNFAYELTPIFHYSETGTSYLKYERGFVSPAPGQLVNTIAKGNNGERVAVLNGLKAETYHTFELGLKERRSNLLASLSLFYTLAKDMIQFSFVGGSHGSGRGSIIYENLNRTQQLGLELNFEQNLDDLSLRTSLSLIKARINKGAKAGSPIPRVPKGKFTLGADYQLIQQLSLFGDFSIYGSSTSSDNTRIKAYSLANVGLKSSFLGFNLDAGIKNLFNSQYNIYESKSSFVPGAGRSYYLQAQYTF